MCAMVCANTCAFCILTYFMETTLDAAEEDSKMIRRQGNNLMLTDYILHKDLLKFTCCSAVTHKIAVLCTCKQKQMDTLLFNYFYVHALSSSVTHKHTFALISNLNACTKAMHSLFVCTQSQWHLRHPLASAPFSKMSDDDISGPKGQLKDKSRHVQARDGVREHGNPLRQAGEPTHRVMLSELHTISEGSNGEAVAFSVSSLYPLSLRTVKPFHLLSSVYCNNYSILTLLVLLNLTAQIVSYRLLSR